MVSASELRLWDHVFGREQTDQVQQSVPDAGVVEVPADSLLKPNGFGWLVKEDVSVDGPARLVHGVDGDQIGNQLPKHLCDGDGFIRCSGRARHTDHITLEDAVAIHRVA